jgi:hypothetical protein
MNCAGRFARELLVDDRADQRLECAVDFARLQIEGPDAANQFCHVLVCPPDGGNGLGWFILERHESSVERLGMNEKR